MNLVRQIERGVNEINARLTSAYCNATALVYTRERGQGILEYGMILAVIGLVALGALKIVGTNLTQVLKEIGDGLTTR